jgi:hypothetical protein
MKGDKITYCRGYEFQTLADYTIQTPCRPKMEIDRAFLRMTTDGLLTIRAGYAWDGPSGPTIKTPSSMRGSLVHDALYQLMREELLGLSNRPIADLMLYDLCREDGMWWWRAKLWHRGVKKFAAFAALPENSYKIYTAP